MPQERASSQKVTCRWPNCGRQCAARGVKNHENACPFRQHDSDPDEANQLLNRERHSGSTFDALAQDETLAGIVSKFFLAYSII